MYSAQIEVSGRFGPALVPHHLALVLFLAPPPSPPLSPLSFLRLPCRSPRLTLLLTSSPLLAARRAACGEPLAFFVRLLPAGRPLAGVVLLLVLLVCHRHHAMPAGRRMRLLSVPLTCLWGLTRRHGRARGATHACRGVGCHARGVTAPTPWPLAWGPLLPSHPPCRLCGRGQMQGVRTPVVPCQEAACTAAALA